MLHIVPVGLCLCVWPCPFTFLVPRTRVPCLDEQERKRNIAGQALASGAMTSEANKLNIEDLMMFFREAMRLPLYGLSSNAPCPPNIVLLDTFVSFASPWFQSPHGTCTHHHARVHPWPAFFSHPALLDPCQLVLQRQQGSVQFLQGT